MERDVLYVGRVSKLDKPKGKRPSENKGIFNKSSAPACKSSSDLQLYTGDGKVISVKPIIMANSTSPGEGILIIDPENNNQKVLKEA